MNPLELLVYEQVGDTLDRIQESGAIACRRDWVSVAQALMMIAHDAMCASRQARPTTDVVNHAATWSAVSLVGLSDKLERLERQTAERERMEMLS